MGFGLMFLGYFATTMMSIPLSGLLEIDLGGLAKCIGYILIAISAKKLTEYHSSFKTLIASSSLMALISAAEAVVAILSFLSVNQIASIPFAEWISDAGILDYVSFFAVIVFVATLCVAIKQIANDTGVRKITIIATRNFVFYCILFAVQALSFMPFTWVETYRPVFVAALLIIELLCWILNLYMIFTCYMKICDSNDVDMKQKPSRFAFVNKKREEEEAERQKILDEYAEKTEKAPKKKKRKK